MFNFFKKKVVTVDQDDFSINNLKNISIQAHKEYIDETTADLIDTIKFWIKRKAKEGKYQYSTMTLSEKEFKDFSQSISFDEWEEFMNVLQNTFKEIRITSSVNNKYWIDFDWSGKEE